MHSNSNAAHYSLVSRQGYSYSQYQSNYQTPPPMDRESGTKTN